MERIGQEVPRYTPERGGNVWQIRNVLDKLERGDVEGIQIAHGQSEDVIVAFVHEYAKMRDAEDAAKAEAKQQRLLEAPEARNDKRWLKSDY
jgi:hypothetical protein